MPAVRMIFEAASEPPTVARPHQARAAPPAQRGDHAAALVAGAAPPTCCARSSTSDAHRSDPAAVTGPMVWGISPEMPGSGLGALTHAMRHVGKVGRPVGGSGRCPPRCSPRSRPPVACCGRRARSTRSLCSGDRVSGIALVDGTEITAPIVVSACNPHDTFLRWLQASAGAGERSRAPVARRPPRRGLRVEDRRRARRLPPVLRGFDRPLGPTTAIAPGLADIDRGAALMAEGRILDRPGHARQRADAARPVDGARRAATCFSLEALYTPFGLRGGWPDSTEPRRWLEQFAELVRTRLPRLDRRVAGDDARRVRARLPPPGRPRDQLRRRTARRVPQRRTPS